MEGASSAAVSDHSRTSSAWTAMTAAEREVFNKSVSTGTALPSRHRSIKSIGTGRTYEASYAQTARTPSTPSRDEDKKVTVVAAQTIKPKTKKKYWCCGELVED